MKYTIHDLNLHEAIRLHDNLRVLHDELRIKNVRFHLWTIDGELEIEDDSKHCCTFNEFFSLAEAKEIIKYLERRIKEYEKLQM